MVPRVERAGFGAVELTRAASVSAHRQRAARFAAFVSPPHHRQDLPGLGRAAGSWPILCTTDDALGAPPGRHFAIIARSAIAPQNEARERQTLLTAMRSFGSLDARTLTGCTPLLEALHHAEDRRHEKNRKAGRRQHAAEHGDAD